GARAYAVTASLGRGEERRPLAEPVLVTGGLVFDRDRAARLDDRGAVAWVDTLRRAGALRVPEAEIDEFLAEAYALPGAPRLEPPPEMQIPETSPVPRPRLVLKAPER